MRTTAGPPGGRHVASEDLDACVKAGDVLASDDRMWWLKNNNLRNGRKNVKM